MELVLLTWLNTKHFNSLAIGQILHISRIKAIYNHKLKLPCQCGIIVFNNPIVLQVNRLEGNVKRLRTQVENLVCCGNIPTA